MGYGYTYWTLYLIVPIISMTKSYLLSNRYINMET